MAESKEGAEIEITLQTEKRSKTKKYKIPASDLSSEESAMQCRQRKILFSNNGRRFRLIIRSASQPVWRFVGGLQLRMEIDAD
jgi:hypothetical protein